MEEYRIYSGGRFIRTNKELEVSNPWDGSVFAKTFLAGKEELDEAILKAQKVRKEMAELPSYERYGILMTIAGEISSKRKHLASVLSQESGKPIKHALAEIDRASQTFTVAAEESKRLPGEYMSIDWTPGGKGREGILKYFPVGIIAGIAPFNFPMNLAVHKIAPAIASGCPIVLKPARSTPLSVLELSKIVHLTSLPGGALSVLPMDRESGNALVTDNRFGKLSFTGSPSVGWKMKENAGKKKVTLELGGNAGVIVTQSADMNTAVRKCITGGFAYSGQVCIHVQRIFVHSSIFGSFSEKFVSGVRDLKSGNPADEDTDISVLIDEENAKRVEKWINESAKQGAKILTGGKRRGSFVEPTVITGTTPTMNVCSQEIFGPVVVIEQYDDFRKAVDMVNDSEYGLQSGVFTNRIDEMNYAFNNLEVGGIMINDASTFRVDHMPYGGVKDSGFGREGIRNAIFEMMEPRLMVKNSY